MADAPPSQLVDLEVEFTPWSEAAEVAFLQSLDVGLMPLSDDPFSRGKCGFKLLQYMACGVPAVASPVGVNVEMCAGGAGRTARSSDEWTREILAIAADSAAAREMAALARANVEARWSASVVCERFAAVVAECARS